MLAFLNSLSVMCSVNICEEMHLSVTEDDKYIITFSLIGSKNAKPFPKTAFSIEENGTQ